MSRTSYNGSGFLTFYQVLATNNPCYKKNVQRSKTTHLILHSTGANNPNLKRYVGPDDGYLGENQYKNYWNTSSADTLVHGVIGKNKNGVIECYQIAPWAMRIWGVGSGSKGNGNDFTIQLEMCEDRTLGASYAKEVYNVAVNMYAHLCKSFNISPSNIWSHSEVHSKGYGSNHGDPESWWNAVGAGLTMDGFRAAVKAKLNSPTGTASSSGNTTSTATSSTGTSSTNTTTTTLYRVRKTWSDSSTQKGAFTSLANAKACADKNPGYSVFNESGTAVYTSASSASSVTSSSSFNVKISISNLNIRKGPGTNYSKIGKYTGKGTFTIVETATGTGSTAGWGLLKSYQSGRNGWVSLDYCTKV